MVIPKAQHENHPFRHRLIHGLEPALRKEVRLVFEKVQLCLAELRADRVESAGAHLQGRRLNDLPVLLVMPTYLLQRPSVSAILRDELGDNRDRFRGIDCKARACTEEVFLAQAVSLEVAAVLVAHAVEAMVTITALTAFFTTCLPTSQFSAQVLPSGHTVESYALPV